jgi:uncharacterized RDD family membrane protein YckC
MKKVSRGDLFDPHETARVESLTGVPLASFKRRAAAFLIDLFFVLLTYIPVEIARQYIVLTLQHRKLDIHVEFDFHDPGNVIWLVLYFGLFVWRTNGFTPGKRMMRIRVVSLTHAKITLWQAVERALGYGASMLEGGFGFVQYFMHPNHCCVHDRIAETIVVREQRADDAAKQLEALSEP